ncbi:MAG: hypothetical protein IJB22_05770 [Clostridia bacterium]|nr:hypothetical protein [Clostridia bacterium]
MKYCCQCGMKLFDGALFCHNCGISVAGKKILPEKSFPKKNEKRFTLADWALLFSVTVHWIGLILGVIGCCIYQDPRQRARSKKAIIISVLIMLALFFFFYFVNIMSYFA